MNEKLPERLILTPTNQDQDIRLFSMPPVPFYIRFPTLNKLMALCNELETGLVQAQTEGGKLMEAVVHHVLAT